MAGFNDRVRSNKFPIDLEKWTVLKDGIFQLGNSCVKPDKMEAYVNSTTELFNWIEQAEIQWLDRADQTHVEADLKKIRNAITMLRNSLKRDEDLDVSIEIGNPATLDDVVTHIIALKQKLSNPRSIRCAFQIGEMLCRLRGELSKDDYRNILKRRICYTEHYAYILISCYSFIKNHRKILLSTLSFHEFNKNFASIRKAFSTMTHTELQEWNLPI